MKRFPNSIYVIIVLLVATLSACAPASSGGLSEADQIATIVAATLNANAVPTVEAALTAEPTAGSQQNAFGNCANTGQISLAYIKDSNVWLWLEGGVKTQLTNTADAVDLRISQDGCRVAYLRSVPNPAYDPNAEFGPGETVDELWVVSSDGSLSQKLAGLEFFATLPPAEENTSYSLHKFEWQPGTHTVAFSTRLGFMGPGLISNNDIHLVDANTPTPTTLLPAGQGGDVYFSPDGQQIAFSTHQEVSVINVDGSNLRSDLITFPSVITYSEYQYSPPVNWTLDGGTLMVAVPPEDGLAEPVDGVFPETALWWIPLDGTPPQEVGGIQNVWFASSEVEFSPDLGRIAYLRPVGDLETLELVIALSDGSNESPAIQLPGIYFGDWAPDNNRFIYYNSDPALHLFMGSADSENVQPISQLTAFEAGGAEVEWVEDETFVLFVLGNAGGELSVMQTSGTGVVVDTFAQPFVSFDVAH
jgi:hypothetical protein